MPQYEFKQVNARWYYRVEGTMPWRSVPPDNQLRKMVKANAEFVSQYHDAVKARKK